MILDNEFSDWMYLPFDKQYFGEDPLFDLLLIKTFKKNVTKYIGVNSPNPLHKEKEEMLQVIIALSVDVDHNRNHEKMREAVEKWTYQDIITDNPKQFINKLKEVNKYHES